MLEHSVVTAADGISALSLFRNHDIDLVITDIIMPGINGIELCRKIRNKNQQVPIIIISGFAQPEYMDKARQLNAIIYEKPVDFTQLKLMIESTQKKVS